ncbi:MAG: hypothetical protein KK482_26545 [Sinorhizobium meliloti]|nr:hypothetical protein [Sinorhizobium meliloti]
MTPLGAVSLLEHALDRFVEEQERYRQGLADARQRRESRETWDGREFASATDLAGKRSIYMEGIEKAHAAESVGVDQTRRAA